jgi:hypothetical protein
VRTIVYIDGFNLYYGSLKGTPYKWLDLCAYFERALPPGYDLQRIKYFTARVTALPHDPLAPARQDVYLRALRAHNGGRIAITEGHFSVKNVRLPLTANPSKIVEVIKTEEKGSDVNLAVELVNDAWAGVFDCAVVVSNDADLERAMKITKQGMHRKVLLFTPGAPIRKPLLALRRWSHKQFAIDPGDLAACQLPDPVMPGNIGKPTNW